MTVGSVTNLEQVNYRVPKRAQLINIPSADATDVGDRIRVRPGDGRIYRIAFEGGEGNRNTRYVRFASHSSSQSAAFAEWLRTQIGQWFYMYGVPDNPPEGPDAVGSVSRLSQVLVEYQSTVGSRDYIVVAEFDPPFTSSLVDDFVDPWVGSQSTFYMYRITVPGRVDTDGVRQQTIPAGGSVPSYSSATLTSVGTFRPSGMTFSRGDPGTIVQVSNANVQVGASKNIETLEGEYESDFYFEIDAFPENPIMILDSTHHRNYQVTEFENTNLDANRWNVQLQRQVGAPINVPADNPRANTGGVIPPGEGGGPSTPADNVGSLINYITPTHYKVLNIHLPSQRPNPSVQDNPYIGQTGNDIFLRPRTRWNRPIDTYSPMDDFIRHEGVRDNVSTNNCIFFSQVDSDNVRNVAIQIADGAQAFSLENGYFKIDHRWFKFVSNVPDVTPGLTFNDYDNNAEIIITTNKFWRTETRNNHTTHPDYIIQEYFLVSNSASKQLNYAQFQNHLPRVSIDGDVWHGLCTDFNIGSYDPSNQEQPASNICFTANSSYCAGLVSNVNTNNAKIYMSRIGISRRDRGVIYETDYLDTMPRYSNAATVINHCIQITNTTGIITQSVYNNFETNGAQDYVKIVIPDNCYEYVNDEPWATGGASKGDEIFPPGSIVHMTTGGFFKTDYA